MQRTLQFILLLHLLICFNISFATVGFHIPNLTFKYAVTFFKQGWGFFGPNPILSNTSTDYKCILEDNIVDWRNIQKALIKIKSPFSDLLISNTSDYLIDSLSESTIADIPKNALSFCQQGDCSSANASILTSEYFKSLTKIAESVCFEQYGALLIGTRLRVTVQNISYYSDRLVKTGKTKDDIIIFPIVQI